MLSALPWNLLLTTALAIVLTAASRLPSMYGRPALRHSLWLLLLVKLVTPPLGRRDVEEVRAEILPLLSPFGGALVRPQSRQMRVIDLGGRLRAISRIVRSMPEPEL